MKTRVPSFLDLVANLWVSPGEIPGNSIDDDGHGYIDDVNGWNFVAHSSDVQDDSGHGALVAGIAGASTHNGIGIAGVCGAVGLSSAAWYNRIGAAEQAATLDM